MFKIIYDNSFYGLLSAIYLIYKEKISDSTIVAQKNYIPDLLSENINVSTDYEIASKIASSIIEKISDQAFDLIFYAYLSELPQIEDYILRFLQKSYKIGKKHLLNLNCIEVNKIQGAYKKVIREKHLYLGIIRFRELKDGSFYAIIEPTNNILPLLGSHFKKRFGNQNWIIHDISRSLALICLQNKLNLHEVISSDKKTLNYDYSDPEMFTEMEADYQKLWKEFFKNISIAERQNPKLQMQFIPKKHWKHLIEKY